LTFQGGFGRPITGIKLLIIAFLLVTVIFPLCAMLAYIPGTNIAGIVAAPQFKQALVNSLATAGTGTAIAIVLAYIFAYCIARTNMRKQEVFTVLAAVPMLIPSISHGMGLLILLGGNGVLTRLFRLSTSIYGFRGIVLGSVLYAFPVAFLMIVDILKYEDGSPYEAAEVLGIPRKNRFFAITFPYLRKPLISVVFAVFTLIFTDYGVPLMIGGRCTTLPVLMYQEVVGLLNFGKGSVIGALLLVPAVIAFLFDLFNKDRGNSNYVVQEITKRKSALRDIAATLYCSLVCLLIALPVLVFALLTFVRKYPVDMRLSFNNIVNTLNMGAGRFLINSLIIAIAVSLIGTILSYVFAYFTARTPGRTSKLLHLISITSLAIPGMVLGLSYVLFFKGSLIYGTLAILILVNTTHFLASPYLMAYNSLGKLNANLEDVGLTLGIQRIFIVRDVLIPQTWFTIMEMFTYFFVNSMMTISAVSFLSPVRIKPVSLMITQFEATMQLESAAFVSLLILGCNFFLKGIIYALRRQLRKTGGLP
jgi:iron(III) transport system permease protein